MRDWFCCCGAVSVVVPGKRADELHPGANTVSASERFSRSAENHARCAWCNKYLCKSIPRTSRSWATLHFDGWSSPREGRLLLCSRMVHLRRRGHRAGCDAGKHTSVSCLMQVLSMDSSMLHAQPRQNHLHAIVSRESPTRLHSSSPCQQARSARGAVCDVSVDLCHS